MRGWLAVLLVVLTFPFQTWTEEHLIERQLEFDEIQRVVHVMDMNVMDYSAEGRTVYVVGEMATSGVLEDNNFPVQSSNSVKLRRQADVWTRDHGWSSQPCDANRKRPENFSLCPIRSEVKLALKPTLGKYKIDLPVLAKLKSREPLPLSEEIVESHNMTFTPKENCLFTSRSWEEPQHGDIRVCFYAVKAGVVTVVARQHGAYLHETLPEDIIATSIAVGQHELRDMLPPQESDALLAALRPLGFLLSIGGVYNALKWADGTSRGSTLSSFAVWNRRRLRSAVALGSALSLFAIGMAWLVWRPLVGLGAFVAGTVLVCGSSWALPSWNRKDTSRKQYLPVPRSPSHSPVGVRRSRSPSVAHRSHSPDSQQS